MCTERVSRIRVLLQGSSWTPLPTAFHIGPITIDLVAHQVTTAGSPVRCTAAEFAVLAVLASRPGQAVHRRELLDHMPPHSRYCTERAVDQHIKSLRRKIERDPRRPTHLIAVHGVGYRLVA